MPICFLLPKKVYGFNSSYCPNVIISPFEIWTNCGEPSKQRPFQRFKFLVVLCGNLLYVNENLLLNIVLHFNIKGGMLSLLCHSTLPPADTSDSIQFDSRSFYKNNDFRGKKGTTAVRSVVNQCFVSEAASLPHNFENGNVVFVKPDKDNDTICLTNTISGAVIWEKCVEQSWLSIFTSN